MDIDSLFVLALSQRSHMVFNDDDNCASVIKLCGDLFEGCIKVLGLTLRVFYV